MKPAFEKVSKGLSANKVLRDALKARSLTQIELDVANGTQVDDTLSEADERLRKIYVQEDDVRYYILPSFFKLLVNLRKQKRNFALIFRTFGSDYDQVELEFNRFCDGTHPL